MKRWIWDYNYGPNLKEHNIGDWVKYEDVARLKELNREMVEVLKRKCEACEYTFYREKDSTTFEDLDCSECGVKQLLAKAEGRCKGNDRKRR